MSADACDPQRRRLLRGLLLGAALGTPPLKALARPSADFNRKPGPGVVERGSAFYRFDTRSLESRDGERRYRITVGTPRRKAPATGYPPLYLLDGNAALAELDQALLAALAKGEAPLLVAIGYETRRRFDLAARERDYTPTRPGQGLIDNRRHSGRKGGGADAFLRLLEHEIVVPIEREINVDESARGLWGHSFGGLFTLYALTQRPALFTRWYAASPSLYWNEGQVLEHLDRWRWPRTTKGQAFLLRGNRELGNRRRGGLDDAALNERLSVLAARLDGMAHFDARTLIVSDTDHGAMLRHSLRFTLSRYF